MLLDAFYLDKELWPISYANPSTHWLIHVKIIDNTCNLKENGKPCVVFRDQLIFMKHFYFTEGSGFIISALWLNIFIVLSLFYH